MDEGPVWIAALKIALKSPDFRRPAIVDRLAFRPLGAAAKFSEKADGGLGEIAYEAHAVEIGAGRLKELDRLAATLGFALADGLVESGHDLFRQEGSKTRSVAGGEGRDDHLIGLPGAIEEAGDVELRVAGPQGGEPPGVCWHFDRRRSKALRLYRRDRHPWGVVGPATNPAPKHGVELEEDHRGEGRQDDEFEIPQGTNAPFD